MLSIVTTLSGILCKYDFDDIIVVVSIKQNKKKMKCAMIANGKSIGHQMTKVVV